MINIFNGNIGFGIGYIIGGLLASWIGSLGLYGIGEAVEKSALAAETAAELRKEIERLKTINDSTTNKVLNNQTIKPDIKPIPTDERKVMCRVIKLPNGDEQCEKCGGIQKAGRSVCWHCEARFIRDT